MRNSKPRIIVEKTEMKGTCYICGKNLASTHGFFIEAPILKQLQTFFEFSEVSLFELMTPHSFFVLIVMSQ